MVEAEAQRLCWGEHGHRGEAGPQVDASFFMPNEGPYICGISVPMSKSKNHLMDWGIVGNPSQKGSPEQAN